MLKVTFDDSGFDKFKRKLKKLGERESVSMAELFPPAFMARHTSVPSFEALIDASGFKVETPEDFAAIPDESWEETVRAHTSFPSWQAMQERGVHEWTKKQLG